MLDASLRHPATSFSEILKTHNSSRVNDIGMPTSNKHYLITQSAQDIADLFLVT